MRVYATAEACWGETFESSGTPEDRWSNLTQINVTQCSGGTLSVTVNATTNQISTSGYQYDASGNMTAEGGTYNYSFDGENRLIQASGMANGPYCYVYDGNGLRVEKFHANGGTCASPQNKVVDMLYFRAITGAAIAETDGTGNTQNEYVFFASQRIARRDASGNVYYYYADQVGSATVITNATGTPCYQATFTPYGEEHATQNTCPQNYKFTGYERDAETGLDYAFARYYNSRLSRFMSPDPLGGDLGDPQSLNRYAYVRNSPTSLIDPSGMLLQDPCNSGGWDPYCEFTGGSEGPGWLGQPYFVGFPDAGCRLDREYGLLGCSLGTASYFSPGSTGGGGPTLCGPLGCPKYNAPPPPAICSANIEDAIQRAFYMQLLANTGKSAYSQQEAFFGVASSGSGQYQVGPVRLAPPGGQATIANPVPGVPWFAFHTHWGSNPAVAWPSTPYNNIAGDSKLGDTVSAIQSGVDIYVISQFGLSLAPGNGGAPVMEVQGSNFNDWFGKLQAECNKHN